MKTNVISMVVALALVWIVSLLPAPVTAQGLNSLLSASETETPSDIDAVMAAAAENGVSVIVIDTNGRVLTDLEGPAQTETGQDMGGP